MKTRLATFTLFTFSFFIACNNQQATTEQASTPAPSQAELMKAAYREIVNAFETGVTDSLGKYVSENSVNHGEPVPGVTSTGLQQLKDMIAVYRTSFSGIKMDYHHVVADGDMLIAHGSWSGNNIGPFMGMPATNKQVNNVQYIDILRWENGKFAEHWEVADGLGMMTQLGVIPQQEGMPAAAPTQLPAYDWTAAVASTPEQAAKMKETYQAVINMIQTGDLTNLGQYLAADFKENMQIPGTTLAPGIEGAKQAMTMLKQVYPDLKMTVEQIAAEGDILIANVRMEGTLASGVAGLPPSAAGKKVNFSTVDIVKFNAEGKATEHWEVGDHYTEMVQLGMIPSPGAEAAAN